jgi:hypothetical protein
MTAILDVAVLVGLIVFNIVMLGSYRYDLRRLEARLLELEAQEQHLTDYVAQFSEHQLDALWNRASEEVDREIVRARKRARS